MICLPKMAVATMVVMLVALGGVERARAQARHQRHHQVDEDTDRGPDLLSAYLDVDVGYHAIDLYTFEANDGLLTANLVPSAANGPTVSVGAGLRPLFFVIGVRGRGTRFEDRNLRRTVGSYTLWSADLEAGVRIPFIVVEPYFLLAGGYSRFGGLDDAIAGLGDGLDVDGANFSAALGVDVFPLESLSVGVRATGELLFLSRRGVPLRDLATPEEADNLDEAERRILEGEGSSVGSGYEITGVVRFIL